MKILGYVLGGIAILVSFVLCRLVLELYVYPLDFGRSDAGTIFAVIAERALYVLAFLLISLPLGRFIIKKFKGLDAKRKKSKEDIS